MASRKRPGKLLAEGELNGIDSRVSAFPVYGYESKVIPFNEFLKAETLAKRAAHTFALARINFQNKFITSNVILEAIFIDADL